MYYSDTAMGASVSRTKQPRGRLRTLFTGTISAACLIGLVGCSPAATDDNAETETEQSTVITPEGDAPENGYPLVVIAGEATGAETDLPEPAVVVQLGAQDEAAEAAETIFAAHASNTIADNAIYGLSTDSAGDAVLDTLYSEYPGMFAGVALSDTMIDPSSDAVGLPNLLTVGDQDLVDVAADLMDTRRANIYDAAVLNPSIAADPASDDARLATDDDLDTVYSADGTATLTLDFERPLVAHRWAVEFGEQHPSRVTIETSIDGETWTEADTVEVESGSIDRYLAPTELSAVRLHVDGGEIADFRVHGQLADERLFSYENYEGDGLSLPYRLFVPENVPADSPITLFLHGSGQRGEDNAQHLGVTKGEGAIRWVTEEEQAEHNSIVVAPQIPSANVWRDDEVIESLEGIINEVADEYGADRDRIYGTGLSIGAEGLLNASIAHPDLFAALLLVAGGPNNPVGDAPEVEDTVIPNAEAFAHIPIWELQAFDDSVRPIEKTTRMIDALRELGVSPRYTVYLPGVIQDVATSSHSSWILAYEDPRIGEWLFSQNRTQPEVLGEPIEPIGDDLTAEELTELAEPDALYYEFH